MKISKVLSVNFKSEWDGNHGKMYSFNYVMENGDAGEASHKTNVAKYSVGTEVEYDFKDGQYPKITFATQGGGGNWKGKSEPKSNASFAMAYAKDLVVAGKIELGDLSEYAGKMLQWMNENK